MAKWFVYSQTRAAATLFKKYRPAVDTVGRFSLTLKTTNMNDVDKTKVVLLFKTK